MNICSKEEIIDILNMLFAEYERTIKQKRILNEFKKIDEILSAVGMSR